MPLLVIHARDGAEGGAVRSRKERQDYVPSVFVTVWNFAPVSFSVAKILAFGIETLAGRSRARSRCRNS